MRFSSLVSPSLSFRATLYAGVVLLVLSLCSAVDAADLTEAGEAVLQDSGAECTPYYYAPSATKLSSFPPIWQSASILPNDSVAQAKWASISGSIPTNISVKGTLAGNFSNVTYPNSDTDCWWTFSKCATPKLAGLPMDIVNVPEPQTLGYGFDDGPNCSHNAFYDYLSSQQQKATMFFIGSNVMDWPLEAQRAITDGHEVCVHTWSHQYMTAFASSDAFAELYYSMQAIKLVTGVTPTCWRPPFGDVDDRIRAIANGLGLRTILWQHDSNDWMAGIGNVTTDTVDADYQALIASANSGLFNSTGAIILTHELNNFTMSEAIKFYPQLKAAFKYIVPIGVSLNKTQLYAETNYSLPTFQQYINGTTNTDMSSTATGSAPASSSSSASGPLATERSTQTGAALRLDPSTAMRASMVALVVLYGATAVFIRT